MKKPQIKLGKACALITILLLSISHTVLVSFAITQTILSFPEEASLGKLFYVTDLPFPRDFIGAAQGKITVEVSKKIGLDVSSDAAKIAGFWKVPALDKIYHLDMSRTFIDDAFLKNMPRLKNLYYLRLDGTRVTDQSLPAIAKQSSLKWIGLVRTQIHGNTLSSLASARITRLMIGYNQLDEKAFDELSKLHSLTGLDIDYSELLWLKNKNLRTDDIDGLSAVAFAKLGSLTNLEDLSFSGLSVGSKSFKVLSYFTKLKTFRAPTTSFSNSDLRFLGDNLILLNLNNCRKIDDGAAVQIARLKKLIQLNCSRTGMTPKGLAIISHLKLRRLDLLGVNLDKSDLKFMKSFTDLRMLDLSNTKVSDNSLSFVHELKNLEHLCVSENRITDSCLPQFLALSKLKFLEISGTDISEKGFLQLKSKLPNCKIIWG